MPSTGPGSNRMSAIRCSYACISGPWDPGPTTPPGTGGSDAHGGWMMVVGGRVVVVGAVVVVVVGAAVVVVGLARFVVFSSRSAEPATAKPDTRSAATTSETSTGGRKTCLRVAPVDARNCESYWGAYASSRHSGAEVPCPAVPGRNLTARSRVIG